MGQTTVFTVSLDADDVAIDQQLELPPRHPFRDAAECCPEEPPLGFSLCDLADSTRARRGRHLRHHARRMGDHGIPDNGGFGDPGVGRMGWGQARNRRHGGACLYVGRHRHRGRSARSSEPSGRGARGRHRALGRGRRGPDAERARVAGRGRRVAWFGARKPAPRVVACDRHRRGGLPHARPDRAVRRLAPGNHRHRSGRFLHIRHGQQQRHCPCLCADRRPRQPPVATRRPSRGSRSRAPSHGRWTPRSFPPRASRTLRTARLRRHRRGPGPRALARTPSRVTAISQRVLPRRSPLRRPATRRPRRLAPKWRSRRPC